MSFPGLDVVFRLAAPAVELLVQRSATAMAEVGDDEAGIGAVGTGLDAGDDAADPAPAAGGVMELLEAADLARGRRGLETAGGAFLEAADVALQGAGRGEAEDVVEAVRLAPVEHFRAGVVAVGADEIATCGQLARIARTKRRRKALISRPLGRFAGRRSAMTKRPSWSKTTIGWKP